MKTNWLTYIIFLALISCCKDEKNFISHLANKGRHQHYIMFIPIIDKDTAYIEISNTELHDHVYKKSIDTSFYDFETYLRLLLNQRKILKKSEIHPYYYRPLTFNPKVEEKYEILGFEKFINQYFEKKWEERGNFFESRTAIPKEEIDTVLKIAFENKYYVGFDDYEGSYNLYPKERYH